MSDFVEKEGGSVTGSLKGPFEDARDHLNSNENEWFIAVNTIPVNRDEIMEGFFDKMGLDAQNNFLARLVKSIMPLLGDGIFDKIADSFFGGGANHTYLSVCEVVDGEPVVREVLHAMGVERDANGNPVLSAQGNLTPVAVDASNFEIDPLYQVRLDQTTRSECILSGGREQIYQGYATMLDTANQIFENGSIKYDMLAENCNAVAREVTDSVDGDAGRFEKLGVGFVSSTFNTASNPITLGGEALDVYVQQQKAQLMDVFSGSSLTIDKTVTNTVTNP